MSLSHASRLGWAPIAEIDPELWSAMESALGNITQVTSDGFSSYHAMVMSATKRLSRAHHGHS